MRVVLNNLWGENKITLKITRTFLYTGGIQCFVCIYTQKRNCKKYVCNSISFQICVQGIELHLREHSLAVAPSGGYRGNGGLGGGGGCGGC